MILFRAVKAKMKKDYIEQLKEKGITHSQDGTSIEKLSYEELLSELSLAEIRGIDVQCDSSKWF